MKQLGNFLASILVLLAVIFIIFLIYKGAQFLSAFIAPLTFISPTVIGIGVILVLLSLIPGLTKPLLPPILIISYILGFFLFVFSAYLTLNVFNVVWLIVGILLCGFGIVPIAIIACIVSAAWPALWHILIMLIAAALFRVYVAKRAVDLAR
ncbi:hypothetical protein J6U78_10015 [bacterium]|jgi:hypothetical protein|nr:hypothetical protein [bacterium]MBR4821121.1 hypothetical protein [bacterium]